MLPEKKRVWPDGGGYQYRYHFLMRAHESGWNHSPLWEFSALHHARGGTFHLVICNWESESIAKGNGNIESKLAIW